MSISKTKTSLKPMQIIALVALILIAILCLIFPEEASTIIAITGGILFLVSLFLK